MTLPSLGIRRVVALVAASAVLALTAVTPTTGAVFTSATPNPSSTWAATAAFISGSRYGWGENTSSYKLGLNTTTATLTPAQLSGDTVADWTAIAAGDSHACAIRATGTLWCWGSGTNAIGGLASPAKVPTQVGSLTSWRRITAGSAHTCGIRSDDSLWCWGTNADGQLGNGSTTASNMTQVSGSAPWRHVSGGPTRTCGVKTNGTLWCWGSGPLTSSSTSTSTTPIQVSHADVSEWRSVTVASNHSCALSTAGAAYCWGANGSGQLGDGTTTAGGPVAVTGGHTFSMLSGGNIHTCGLRSSDQVILCWGGDGNGQLGNGSSLTSAQHTPGPVDLSGATWRSLASGYNHACASLASRKVVYCWGANGSGQVGDGTQTGRASPTSTGLTASAVATGMASLSSYAIT